MSNTQILRAQNLQKSYGGRTLFEGLDLAFHTGKCTALVGANGSGKSTLLKILAGKLSPDEGRLIHDPGITVAYLPQDPAIEMAPDATVEDLFQEAWGDLKTLSQEMGNLEERLEDPSLSGKEMSGLLQAYGEAQEEWAQKGGYDAESRMEEALQGLGLAHLDKKQSLSTMSGGEIVRAALAALLFQQADFLLLDEPTNHLDQDALEWLEERLKSYSHCLVLISHDRDFLDALVEGVVELEEQGSSCRLFLGNYSAYQEQRRKQKEKEWEAFHQYQEDKKELKRELKSKTHNARQGKPPKDGNKILYSAQKDRETAGRSRLTKTLKKKLEVLDEDPPPKPETDPLSLLRFQAEALPSQMVLDVRDLSLSYGERKLIENLSFQLIKGDRLILQGPNGAGKSSLMKVLLKSEEREGQIHWAKAARIGYLDQEQKKLDWDRSPLEELGSVLSLPEEELRSQLHKTVSLRGEDVSKKIGDLSPGQRQKLQILKLSLQGANVLLLDEAPNHLDLPSLEALENALLNFQGSLIAISHDRRFSRKIGTRIIQI